MPTSTKYTAAAYADMRAATYRVSGLHPMGSIAITWNGEYSHGAMMLSTLDDVARLEQALAQAKAVLAGAKKAAAA